jgi:cell division protein FtsW (lipid II flippase)
MFSEAVAGLVGRADVGAALFYLASWLSYHRGCHHTTTRWSWIFLSMVFAALSMFTKEQGLTVIGVCLLYDVVIISRIRIKDFFLSIKKVK